MNNQQIYAPQGVIDHSNESQFQEKLLKLIYHSEINDIVLDFKGVEFVDSSGLIALVSAYKEAKKENKNLYLSNVSPSVKMIFEISRLDKVLGIHQDVYEQVLGEDELTEGAATPIAA